jgi:hypothetical protein
MKLVCLNDMILIRDVRGNRLKKHQSLKIGKIYDVHKIYEVDNYVRVWFNEADVPLTGNDIRGTLVLPKGSFITLEEWRERQLKEIGL